MNIIEIIIENILEIIPIKIWIYILIIVFFGFLIYSFIQSETKQTTIPKNSIVKVIAKSKSLTNEIESLFDAPYVTSELNEIVREGYGFIIDLEKKIIITANHIIGENAEITISINNSKYEAKKVSSDKKNDIALLKLKNNYTINNITKLKLSNDFKINDSVFILKESLNEGTIKEIIDNFPLNDTINLNKAIKICTNSESELSSGAPVLNKYNEVIGIIIAKSNQEKRCQIATIIKNIEWMQ